MNKFDVIIIGAGPAGLMAAMQAKRQGLLLEIFEKNKPGGQALAANLIENFPGYPDAIRGPELMQRFVDQVNAHGIKIEREEVLDISKRDEGFIVRTKKGVYGALAVIVASGLNPRRLGIPGEKDLIGKLVFAYENPDELPCHGKSVLIIGSGDAAFDQGLNFSRLASDVAIAMRGDKPRCAPLLLERAKHAKIEILTGYDAKSMKEAAGRVHIEFANGEGFEADLVDVCIGKERTLDFVSAELLDPNVPGVFWAGDCHRDLDRHISIACGDGTAAAMDAAEYVKQAKDPSPL